MEQNQPSDSKVDCTVAFRVQESLLRRDEDKRLKQRSSTSSEVVRAVPVISLGCSKAGGAVPCASGPRRELGSHALDTSGLHERVAPPSVYALGSHGYPRVTGQGLLQYSAFDAFGSWP